MQNNRRLMKNEKGAFKGKADLCLGVSAKFHVLVFALFLDFQCVEPNKRGTSPSFSFLASVQYGFS